MHCGMWDGWPTMGDLTPGIAQSPPAGMPPFIYRLRVDAVSGDAALRVM